MKITYKYLQEKLLEWVPDSVDWEVDESLTPVLMEFVDRTSFDTEYFMGYYRKYHCETIPNLIRPSYSALKHPVILVIIICLDFYGDFLKREWPLSHDELLKVHQTFGVSFGEY